MNKTNNLENSTMRSSFSLLIETQDSRIPSNSEDPCQICGDVGDKRLIMVCFNCRESREHTYCAEVLLPSVPDIWICEDCRSTSQTSTVRDDKKTLANNGVTNSILGLDNSDRSEKCSCNHVGEAPLRSAVRESCHGRVANNGSEHLPRLILSAHTNTKAEEDCFKLLKIPRRKRQQSQVRSSLPPKKKQEPLKFTDIEEVRHQDS